MNDDREQLLAAYVTLVGKVSRSLHSRLWWATDFSSKNRFKSRLPDLIQEFIQLVQNTVKDKSPAVLGSVSWQIRLSLKKYFKKAGMAICVPSFGFILLRDVVSEFFRRLIGGVYHFFRLIFRNWYTRFLLSAKFQNDFADPRPVYLIKTFVYDHSFANDGMYNDVFFGELQKFLQEKGERVIFFANILGDFKSCVKKIKHCSNAVILPIDFFGSVFPIFESVLVSCFYWPQVKEPVNFLNYEVSDLINAELSSCSSYIQPYQFLHYRQTKALLKKFSIKTFLFTFENNPWEKMCVLALREFSPQTKILGYQHTVTVQASANMFSSIEEEAIIPKPDCILTVGAVTKRIIERYTQISSLPIVAACALRYESLWPLAPLPRTKTFNILLALDGVVDVYKMVNCVIDQLDGQKKYKIIIRTHPVLPVELIAHKLGKRLHHPFVEISKGYLPMQDIKRTDMTIYWGSTVALESLWVGKPIINFDTETLFSYDPLLDCPHLRWTVNTHQNLTAILDEIYTLSDERFIASRQKACEYLQEYFYPVNALNLTHFLS